MKYQGIIFDLDGVLCCTDQFHYQAWKETADEIGVYFYAHINERLRGVSRMESLDIMLERAGRGFSQKEKLALARRKNERYQALLRTMTPADLDARTKATLEALRGAGLRLAVGSSSKNTPLILERLGLADYFDAVSDGNNIARSKPDPEVFLKAAAMLDLPPRACLVVEDALAGVDAAVAGGFDSAGLGQAADHPRVTYALASLPALRELLLPGASGEDRMRIER